MTLEGPDIRYVAPPGFGGTDRFTYTLEDEGTTRGIPDPRTAVGTVLVIVTAVNLPPVAVDDERSTPEDRLLTFSANDLLANDGAGSGGQAGQRLTVIGVSATSVQGGSVRLENGVISYGPPTDFNGLDQFTYRIQDTATSDDQAGAREATGTVRVTVTEVNDPPVAAPDTIGAVEGLGLVLRSRVLVSNDVAGPLNEGDQTLTVTGAGPESAQGGSVVLANGEMHYTPLPGFTGSDSFSYTVSDDGSTAGMPDPLTARGTVTVIVSARPEVRLERVAHFLQVSWPVSATRYLLQETDALDGEPVWRTIVFGTEIIGDRQVLMINISQGARFFRLRQQ